ncbi:MAG: hypothetical protein M1834_002518 [Cirrosporium novae-zelandiae]|nr:MAG: hypothetical protein M1834_002518 [Cirrosporium novae-zelandiae]
MGIKKLQTAVAGLGRMGKRHATNFLNRTPRCELIAAFSPDATEIEWAKENLEPYGVTLYTDYKKMLEHPGLEAMVVSTATPVHAEETIQAIEKGLHTLCEKPLSLSVDVCKTVIEAANKRPDLKVMCGFSRRFDQSYRDAWKKMDDGLIGSPCVIRSQTCDKNDPSGFFIEYARKSGGVFVDMSIHDIDLTLWFLGENLQLKSVSAYGITSNMPQLQEFGDCDNAVGVVEFYGGKLAHYFCSRIMAHGQEDSTEVIGTDGKLAINTNPQSNLVLHSHPGGVSRDVPPHYYGRFEMAFVTEANEFTAACLDDTPLPLRLSTAVIAVEIGAALQEALHTGKSLHFDENGKRIERASL